MCLWPCLVKPHRHMEFEAPYSSWILKYPIQSSSHCLLSLQFPICVQFSHKTLEHSDSQLMENISASLVLESISVINLIFCLILSTTFLFFFFSFGGVPMYTNNLLGKRQMQRHIKALFSDSREEKKTSCMEQKICKSIKKDLSSY